MSQEEIPVTQNSDEVQFPVGMRVLALDGSSCCLRYLCSLLTACRYKVTATTKAEEALQILRKDTEEFDIVITNIVRQDIDGFELLKIIGTEMGLPVVIVSCLDDQASIRRAIYHGARDYLLKPVRLQEISNIWQHVLRKNLGDPQKSIARKEVQVERSFIPERAEDKLDKEQDETNTQSTETSSSCKKRRFAWTPELHRKFTDAIQELGERKAFPNDILRLMNIPGLTRENVASHLQKYRNTLKKQSTAMAEQKNVELGLTVARGNADIKKGSGAGLETTNMQVTGNYVIRPGIHAPMSPIQSPIFMGQMQQGMYSHVYGDRPSATLPSDTLLPSLEFKFPNSFPETKLQDGYIGVASRPSCSSRIYSQANPWSRPVSSYNNIAQAGPRNVPPFSYYHIAQADPNPRPPCSNNHPDQAGSSVLDQTGPISTRLYPHPFSVYHHSQVLGDSLSQMGASSQYPSVAWSFQNLQPDQDKRRRCLLNYGETGDTNLKQSSIECAEYLKDPKLTDLKGKEPCEGVPYFSAQPDAEIGFNQHGGTCADDEITAIIKEWNNDGPS